MNSVTALTSDLKWTSIRIPYCLLETAQTPPPFLSCWSSSKTPKISFFLI